MRVKLVVAAALLAASATPTLAAEFYIVQDTSTHRCTIVEQRPTSRTMVIVGPGTAYTTRGEAEGAMKTVKVCESGGTVGGPVPAPAPGAVPPPAPGGPMPVPAPGAMPVPAPGAMPVPAPGAMPVPAPGGPMPAPVPR